MPEWFQYCKYSPFKMIEHASHFEPFWFVFKHIWSGVTYSIYVITWVTVLKNLPNNIVFWTSFLAQISKKWNYFMAFESELDLIRIYGKKGVYVFQHTLTTFVQIFQKVSYITFQKHGLSFLIISSGWHISEKWYKNLF